MKILIVLTLLFYFASCTLTATEFKQQWRMNLAAVTPTPENLQQYAVLVNATLQQKAILIGVEVTVPPTVVVPIIRGLLLQNYSVSYNESWSFPHRLIIRMTPYDAVLEMRDRRYDYHDDRFKIISSDKEQQDAFLESFELQFGDPIASPVPHFIGNNTLAWQIGMLFSKYNFEFEILQKIQQIDLLIRDSIGNIVIVHVTKDIAIHVAIHYMQQGFEAEYSMHNGNMRIYVDENYPNDGAVHVLPYNRWKNITLLPLDEMIWTYHKFFV